MEEGGRGLEVENLRHGKKTGLEVQHVQPGVKGKR
jgi:hypothetical protein